MRASVIVLFFVVLNVVFATRFILKKGDGTVIRGDYNKFESLLDEFENELNALPESEVLERDDELDNKKEELIKLLDSGVVDEKTARAIYASYVFDYWEDVFHDIGIDLKFSDRDGDDATF